jgi:predicted TIM-barrel fold metal-dependent hydrolase
VGWIVAQAGADLVLFSSDYPHVEGGRKPLERFEASLDEAGAGEAVRRAFYTDNFLYLMGRAGLALAA